jgi:hypothetical protein
MHCVVLAFCIYKYVSRRRFFSSPERSGRPWDPPSLLFGGCRGVKWPGREPGLFYLLPLQCLRITGAIPPFACMSVCGGQWQFCETLGRGCVSACSITAPTGRCFMKFNVWGLFENPSRGCVIKIRQEERILVYEDLCSSMLHCRRILLKMRDVWEMVVENVKTFLC